MSNDVNCNGVYRNIEREQFWAHLSQSKMLNADYPAYQPSFCGGIHMASDHSAGKYGPYTELREQSSIDYWGRSSNRIVPWLSDSSHYLSLRFSTDPIDTIALERKMGASTFDGSFQQSGLVNISGPLTCIYGPLCTDDSAAVGNLDYFIAPID